MKRKSFALFASLFLVLAIVVSCSPEPYSKYPSVDCLITLDAQGYDEQLTENVFVVVGNKGVKLPILEDSDMVRFLGWSTEPKNRDKIVETADGVFYPTENKDITLYAVWTNKSVTIYYYYNYDDVERIYNEVTVDYNIWETLGSNGYYKSIGSSKDGVEFAGWSYEKEAKIDDLMSEQEVRDMPLPLEDTKLYAQWKKPVEVTFNVDGMQYGDTIKLESFDSLSETIENMGVPTKGEDYRFAYWTDKNGKRVNSNDFIYSSQTFNALFGEAIDIKFMYKAGHGDEWIELDTDIKNYQYSTYSLPAISDNIPYLAYWTADKEGEIRINEGMPVDDTITILYAKNGLHSHLVTNSTEEVNENNIMIVMQGEKKARIVYQLENYHSAVLSYLDEERTIRILDKDGNFLPNIEKDGIKYTDKEGVWLLDNVPDKIFVRCVSPVGGEILFKNKEIETKYTFYDEDYNILEENDSTATPTYSGGKGIPCHYYVEGDMPKGDDIEAFGYVVVYDENGESNNEKFIGGGDISNRISFFSNDTLPDEINATISDYKNKTGMEMTNLLIEHDSNFIDNTIAYWVDKVRKDSGFDDLFVPAYKELNFMVNDISTKMLLSFLGIQLPQGGEEKYKLWTSSCMVENRGTELKGNAKTLTDVYGSTKPITNAFDYKIFLMRLI